MNPIGGFFFFGQKIQLEVDSILLSRDGNKPVTHGYLPRHAPIISVFFCPIYIIGYWVRFLLTRSGFNWVRLY